MRKRYWIVGAILFCTILGQLGNDDSKQGAGIATTPVGNEKTLPTSSRDKTLLNALTHSRASETSSTGARSPQTSNPQATLPIRYVTGNRVALRKTPSTAGKIVDRLDSARKVLLLEQSKDWSHVRDEMTLRDGWVASRFLADRQKPKEEKPAESKNKTEEAEKSIPAIPDSIIVQRIIAESLASYPSSCACPYSTDRGGRRCGKRSAYSKPGGYAPICFAQDVTRSMIEAFRRQ